MLEVVGILLFALLIALSIALHEVGHLVPAKKFGLRVPDYMVGFGPTNLVKKFAVKLVMESKQFHWVDTSGWWECFLRQRMTHKAGPVPCQPGGLQVW